MDPRKPGDCRDPGCGCGSTSRRDFIKVVGLTASSLAAAGRMPVMAGPFEDNEYLQTIPRDKKLQGVDRLADRAGHEGRRDRSEGLAHIGMPVGGLFAGTVYLGGDGRLWLWDIFNRDQEGNQPRMVAYRGDAWALGTGRTTSSRPNRGALRAGLRDPRRAAWRRLDRTGFDRIAFDGRYPIGRVSYRAGGCPVRVELEAFSPFIPLEVEIRRCRRSS